MKDRGNRQHPQDDKKVPFRLETKEGSIIILSMGSIICRPPYSVRDKIYPIGFQSVRSFFDIRNPQIVSRYTNEIADFGDRPIFSVTPENYPEERVVALSPNECWKIIAEMVLENSDGATSVKNIDGADMFGLSYVNSLNKELLLNEYKTYFRPASFVVPTWYQSKPKRKRRANPKYLESPQKNKRNKRGHDSDSDFDFDEDVQRPTLRERFPDPEPTPAARQAMRESNQAVNNNTYAATYLLVDDNDSQPNLFGIFSTLCDFLSKKKR
jgi:hypothetical protein